MNDIVLTEKQKSVISVIERLGPTSLKQILQGSDCLDSKREVETVATQLVVRNVLEKQSNGYFKLGRNHPSATKRTKKSQTRRKSATKPPVSETKAPDSATHTLPSDKWVKPPAKPSVEAVKAVETLCEQETTTDESAPHLEALEKLKRQLNGKQIERLDVKVDTLNGLAALLDPTISDVLLEIVDDYKGMECA